MAGVIAGPGFQCVTPLGDSRRHNSYKSDNGAWLNAAGITHPVLATPAHSPGMDVAMTPGMALEDVWI